MIVDSEKGKTEYARCGNCKYLYEGVVFICCGHKSNVKDNLYKKFVTENTQGCENWGQNND